MGRSGLPHATQAVSGGRRPGNGGGSRAGGAPLADATRAWSNRGGVVVAGFPGYRPAAEIRDSGTALTAAEIARLDSSEKSGISCAIRRWRFAEVEK